VGGRTTTTTAGTATHPIVVVVALLCVRAVRGNANGISVDLLRYSDFLFQLAEDFVSSFLSIYRLNGSVPVKRRVRVGYPRNVMLSEDSAGDLRIVGDRVGTLLHSNVI
jgi:hypothetical protein